MHYSHYNSGRILLRDQDVDGQVSPLDFLTLTTPHNGRQGHDRSFPFQLFWKSLKQRAFQNSSFHRIDRVLLLNGTIHLSPEMTGIHIQPNVSWKKKYLCSPSFNMDPTKRVLKLCWLLLFFLVLLIRWQAARLRAVQQALRLGLQPSSAHENPWR